MLADMGVHLLTGGGGGVMESVSRAFFNTPHRKGLVIGIIPAQKHTETGEHAGPKTGYPNPYVEVPIYTHLHKSGEKGSDDLSRNHINILSSNLLIALPGGSGTSSEVRLAVETYHRPLIAYLDNRSQIPDIPDHLRVESDFGKVTEFVRVMLESIGGNTAQ